MGLLAYLAGQESSASSLLASLEVSGLKALGEPAIDRRQDLTGFVALALLLPQVRQAHRRP
jgi:hypothetical protein